MIHSFIISACFSPSSGKIAKSVLEEVWENGSDVDKIIETKGLVQIQDESLLEEIAKKIIDSNPDQVAAYKDGKDKLFGFFVGQVMKNGRIALIFPGVLPSIFLASVPKSRILIEICKLSVSASMGGVAATQTLTVGAKSSEHASSDVLISIWLSDAFAIEDKALPVTEINFNSLQLL